LEIKGGEFELQSLRNQKDEKVPINDYDETLEYYRREKFRQDLFANKSPKMVPNSFEKSSFLQSQEASILSEKKRNKIQKRFSHSIASEISNSNCHTPKCLSAALKFNSNIYSPLTERIYSGKIKDSSQTLQIASPKNKTPNSCAKITFSPKLRSVFQEQRKVMPLKQETIGLERPITMVKNNKNLIFFKKKIIQIENNFLNLHGEEIKKNEPLISKIINGGSTPTKFFFKKKEKKSSSTYNN